MAKPKPTLNQADLELLEQRFANKDDVRQIVKEELQPVKKELKSIKKDTSDLIDFLDKDLMEISKKVKRIETHPGTSL